MVLIIKKWVRFAVNFRVLTEDNKFILLVEGMKSIFSQICSSEDFRVSLLDVEELHGSLLVNA